jgi:hypothetical protein
MSAPVSAQEFNESVNLLVIEQNSSVEIFVESGGDEAAIDRIYGRFCERRVQIGNAIYIVSKQGESVYADSNLTREQIVQFLGNSDGFDKFIDFEIKLMKRHGFSNLAISNRVNTLYLFKYLLSAPPESNELRLFEFGDQAVVHLNAFCEAEDERRQTQKRKFVVGFMQVLGGMVIVGIDGMAEGGSLGFATPIAGASAIIGTSIVGAGVTELFDRAQ